MSLLRGGVHTHTEFSLIPIHSIVVTSLSCNSVQHSPPNNKEQGIMDGWLDGCTDR